MDYTPFFELSTDLLCVVDTENEKFIQVNNRWSELLGYSTSELTEKPYWHFMVPEDAVHTLNYLSYVKANPLTNSQFINRYRTKEGQAVYIKWLNSKSLDNGKHLQVAKDITQEVSSEADASILDCIVDSSLAGYWDWHVRENVEYYSPFFKEMLGYTSNEFPDTPESWQKAISPSDLPRMLRSFERHIASKGEEPISETVQYRHKTGKIIHVLCRGKVVSWDHEGKPLRVVGSHVDVSNNLKLIKEQEKHQQDMRMLLSILSHDMKSPLNTIYGFLSLIQDSAELSEEHQDWLSRCLGACAYGKTVVDNVYLLSQVSQTRDFARVSLQSLIRDALKFLATQYDLDSVDIEISSTLPNIVANKFCAVQVITNVLDNSLKFSLLGKKACIKLSAYKNQGLIIEDNGPGVPENQLKRIFDMFYRTQRKKEGTGAGLGIVKKVMEIHGGDAWAELCDPTGLRIYLDFNHVHEK